MNDSGRKVGKIWRRIEDKGKRGPDKGQFSTSPYQGQVTGTILAWTLKSRSRDSCVDVHCLIMQRPSSLVMLSERCVYQALFT